MKLLLIGGFLGFVIGVFLTVFYFALAEFFRVQARVASKIAKITQEPRTSEAKSKAAGLK